ncbi:hypothetical protein OE699_01040 [Sedimentimonas flavescens]|uniref:Uncharacterized protein n=1 Tax=Sedimentimonas flavescens TaxID=2851012 RepID=A0ABT2ZUW4_9RHOB|nr:hypothetical protein [Sedimentimonas flavescens]MCV2877423.1 hypothetical protein [Sedimentimonas flavescens]
MTVLKFVKKSERDLAQEALQVLEEAYAYYTPEAKPVSAGSDLPRETPLEQMYGYYSAA